MSLIIILIVEVRLFEKLKTKNQTKVAGISLIFDNVVNSMNYADNLTKFISVIN